MTDESHSTSSRNASPNDGGRGGPASPATPESERPSEEAEATRIGVVVPAAGAGHRMGGEKKTFLEVQGIPVLLRAVQPFLRHPDVVSVVVALAPDDAAQPPDWLVGADARIRVVTGGGTRTESVRAGLAALPPDVTVVLIHDGARPLVTTDVIEGCIEVAKRGQGAVAGFPAVDTMKETDGEGRIVRTPDRARLWHAQTPQAFPRWMVEEAYAPEGGGGGTDDASLVERAGHPVVMVEAGAWNLKVTRPVDIDIADLILSRR